MSFTSKFTLTSPTGVQHNILLELETPEELLATEQAFLDAGLTAFKTVTASAGPPTTDREAPVAKEQAQTGQLHSRFQVAVIERHQPWANPGPGFACCGACMPGWPPATQHRPAARQLPLLSAPGRAHQRPGQLHR